MLNVNHLITLLGIFFTFVIIGGIIRVVYNSDKGSNVFIRLKSLFVLQFILPLILPVAMKKNRYKIIKMIEEDNDLDEERKERLFKILKDDREFESFIKFSKYGFIIYFKDLLDNNIENLNVYKRDTGEELNLNIKITFKGVYNPFIMNGLLRKNNYFEHIYKEGQ